MKTLLATIAILVSALAGAQPSTQSITTAQEGRLAVAQCYSDCIALAAESDHVYNALMQAELSSFRRTLADVGAGNRRQADANGQRDDFVALLCSSKQAWLYEAESCRSGCLDVEAVYPSTPSNARKTFNEALNRSKATLGRSGLWVRDYASSPKAGTPRFDAACQRHMDQLRGNGSSSAASAFINR